MKKTTIFVLLLVFLVGCAAQVADKTTVETKEPVKKEIQKVEEKVVQTKEPVQETKPPEITEEPQETEATLTVSVGETKTIYIGGRKYDVKLLSVSNRARFSINGELTKELMITGVYTLKDQSEVKLLRLLFNAAELKIKIPPPKGPLVTEAKLTGTGPHQLAIGIFQTVEKTTAGHVEIVRTAEGGTVLQLHSFVTQPGSGLYVYLIDQNIADGYEVAKLTTITGGQTYNLHDDIDLNKYKKVVIYSKSEEKVYGEAELS